MTKILNEELNEYGIPIEEDALSSFTFKKWFNQYGHEDEGLRLALGLDPYGEDPVDVDAAKKWFDRRKHEVSRILSAATQGNEVIVYRCMKVKSDWVQKIKDGEKLPLGYHWTISQDLAPFLCGGTGGRMGDDHVILKGAIPLKQIEVDSLFNPSWSGDDSEEFEVASKQDQIKLLTVYSGNMKTELATPNTTYPMSGFYESKIDEWGIPGSQRKTDAEHRSKVPKL